MNIPAGAAGQVGDFHPQVGMEPEEKPLIQGRAQYFLQEMVSIIVPNQTIPVEQMKFLATGGEIEGVEECFKADFPLQKSFQTEIMVASEIIDFQSPLHP